MRKNKGALVLVIGSSKITAIIGEYGLNNSFVEIALADSYYDGFSKNRFLDEENFSSLIEELTLSVLEKSRRKFSEIFVGVPACFVKLKSKKLKAEFPRKRKIIRSDLEALENAGKNYVLSGNDYKIIHSFPQYFILDDGNKTDKPLNAHSTVLAANFSYILCEKYFCDLIGKALKNTQIEKINFVFETMAESGVISGDEYDVGIPWFIIDVGYISTGAVLFENGKVLSIFSSDFGGAYLNAWLCERYGIDFFDAEELKKKINFGLSGNDGTMYSVTTESGDTISLPVDDVNSFIVAKLDNFLGELHGFISDSLEERGKNYDGEENVKLIFTGGGLSYYRGVELYLSGRLEIPVEIVSPDIPLHEKPTETAKFALLKFALDN
ncbi:MAG: hypothetical protein IJ706_05510 [Clostridia bacterium]|nr:hypothetical protein [Clostridia bacterium]